MNSGKANLIITDVRSSCSCTVGEYPEQEVKPGKGGVVVLTTTIRTVMDGKRIYATIKSTAKNDYEVIRLVPY